MNQEPTGIADGLDAFFDGSRGDRLAHSPVEGFHEPLIPRESDFVGSFIDPLGEVVRQPEVHMFRHGTHASTCASNIGSDSVRTMTTENGKRIGPNSLKNCKRCGVSHLAWTQTKAGKWYLCDTFPSQSEISELYIMATWSAHKCGTKIDDSLAPCCNRLPHESHDWENGIFHCGGVA